MIDFSKFDNIIDMTMYFNTDEKCEEYKKKYSDFVDHPDEDGVVTARFGWPYLEYKEENFGCHWYEEPDEY